MKKQKEKSINNTRLVGIDMMIGLAMTLVVLGHTSIGKVPYWYSHGLHNWIYSFHMELFLFLSAFLIRYTYKGVKSPLEYGKYIWRKFKKFFIWFILIGMTVALLACPMKGITLSADYVWYSLRTLLLYPRYSEASFLWYIYILFGYYLISPLFFQMPQWGRVLICVATLFLPMLPEGHFLAAFDFCQYSFFYCLGVLCAEWIEEIRSAKLWQWGLMSVPFVAWTAWVFSEGMQIGFEHPQLGWWHIVTGVSAIPFFFLISMALKKIKSVNKTLTLISKDCYWIYLLQMFVIWGIVWVIQKTGLLGSISFTVFIIIASLLAIAMPIAIAEFIRFAGRKALP
jgi:fucose 4-O-acetylase-like acetyltransferase